MSAGADLIGRARRSFGSVRNDGLAPHIARMSARNVLANHRRGEVRRQARSVELDAEMVDLYGAAPDNGVELTAIGEVFRSLPDDDRELLSLVAWEGLDRRQIATALGVSRNAVGIRLHRARPLLRPGEHPGRADRLADADRHQTLQAGTDLRLDHHRPPRGNEQLEHHPHEGPVAPCVLVPDDTPKVKEVHSKIRLATTEGGSLAGYRVDEKTVGEVLPEIEKRGLKATYLVMAIPPGNPGGFGELRSQDTPVGDDWIVWEAEEEKGVPGKVILLVTDERYARNPVYGGPRDNVIHD
ncbi:RNA polymerase sigma factor [Microtetraspora malaysiensis]|uniref:RNA polymerase sigma factor n=1 Tax=Microtetraspora malaysiensis TaxID=161358 RepID=A0ABW6T4H6_9ACTN